MQNIDDIYEILLEKEKLLKSLQDFYKEVILGDNHYLKSCVNSKKTSIIVLSNLEVKIYISLEMLGFFQYRVSVWFLKDGLYSSFYDVKSFYFKISALNYINQIKLKFSEEDIKKIFLDYIEVLNESCVKAYQDIKDSRNI